MDQKKEIKQILKKIYHPQFECYLDSKTVLKGIEITKSNQIKITFYEVAGSTIINDLAEIIEEKLFKLSWIKELEIQLSIIQNQAHKYSDGLKNVKHVIAVSSCKGGVGKSTIALNLAATLNLNGAQVGILDADIHGPSLPALIQPKEIGHTDSENHMPPFINKNLKLMSYGYIQKEVNQPAILRGPIASNVLKQLLYKTDWGFLDYLIIDCPPGTGDILLSISQEVKVSASVIITTPHELSYIDVIKGIKMFDKVNVPNFAIIENMSYFKCNNCDEKHMIFGSGRLQGTCRENNIKNWYEIPIHQKISTYSNKQIPFINTVNDKELINLYKKIASDLSWYLTKKESNDEINISFNNESQKVTITKEKIKYDIQYKTIRVNCTCAHCVDEITGEKLININEIDPNLKIEKVFPVGHYAYGFDWLENDKKHHSMIPIEKLFSFI